MVEPVLLFSSHNDRTGISSFLKFKNQITTQPEIIKKIHVNHSKNIHVKSKKRFGDSYVTKCPKNIPPLIQQRQLSIVSLWYTLLKLIQLLATVVEGDPKDPFSIATTLRCREGCYPFPWLLHFTLGPYLIRISVKQGGIKYHFLSLLYDSTWDWT